MKKMIALALLTAAAIFVSLNVPEAVESFLPQVGTVRMQQMTYSDCVNASGQVENNTKREIKAAMPLILNEIKVAVGDNVKAGDVVATVDMEQTAEKLIALKEDPSYAKLISSSKYAVLSQAGSKEELLAMIPDVLTADSDGIVYAINASAGVLVEADAVVMAIVRSQDLVVKVAVSESNISKVILGQRVELTGTAFPGIVYMGAVAQIYPSARRQYVGTTQETVVDVVVRLDAPDSGIKAGYSVKAKIVTSEEKTVSVLPYEAIGQDQSGVEYVYVFDKGVARRRNIKTGTEYSDGVEVQAGLQSGDIILASPDTIGKDGNYVKVKQ